MTSSSDRDVTDAFWLSFLRLGFAVVIAEGVATGAYLVITPNGPNRAVLSAIAAMSVAAGAANLIVVPWISRQPWRETFSLLWTLLGGPVLSVCVVLDGGLSSPLVFLGMVPVMYGALVFGPKAVGACVLASIAELSVIAALDTGANERPGVFLMALSVAVCVGFVVWLTSRQRSRLQRQADDLIRELEMLATTDSLTGCLNHRAFFARVSEELERAVRYNQPLSLVVADVDSFKSLNDSLGHAAGDAALRLAGERLRAGSRLSDVVGRIGGDEFALLLPATTLAEATAHARRLLAPQATVSSRVTFSGGVASVDGSEPTADRLFRDADEALYQAKRTGRARVAALLASIERVSADAGLSR